VKRLFIVSFLWGFLSLHLAFAQGSDTLRLKPLVKGLAQATSLYITPSGKLYITEATKNRILILDQNGQRLDSLGNLGSGNYQFDTPVDIDATNGLKVYVADYNNHRIQVFDRREQYLSTIRNDGHFGAGDVYDPAKLCVNNRGQLYFFDDNSGYIIMYNARGQFDQVFNLLSNEIVNTPSDMIASDDRVYVSDPKGGVIDIISNTGQFLGFIEGTKKVGAIAINDRYLWACMPNYLKIFEKRGALIEKFVILPNIKPIGLSIHQDRIFVLTADRLYRIEKPNLR